MQIQCVCAIARCVAVPTYNQSDALDLLHTDFFIWACRVQHALYRSLCMEVSGKIVEARLLQLHLPRSAQ